MTNPFGAVGLYAEFVEKDSVRHSDSEGAVAVGGDAYFGDPAKPSGFSVGSRLTAADPAELPGGHSVVVGGTLYANNVVLDKGTGVAGEVVNRSTPGRGFGVDGDKVRTGTSPVDFGKEFTELRKLSTGWAGVRPDGEVSADPSGQGVFLTGTDAKLNVFAVKASDLERAGAISLKVPAGSSTLVNVLGGSYDMHAEPTYGVWIWDENTKGFVQDDYNSGSDAFKQVRSKLLWNLPQAETVKKNHSSRPGTILAPDAAVSTGSASYGPGHVNGSVIAESLTTVPGAETHRMNFTGCLPGGTTPGPIVTPEPPKPTETPTTPAPSATPEGDLATTGSSVGPGVIGAGAAVVLAGGALLAFAKRRRRAS
ncbi:choice-of-anchor A family protein [Streptomyces cinereoruber]|uniref:choice-of-anchor A family protein n=1 Tax=Streptomyces cinereoruber TaxID=67260 RepID=UPI0017EB14C2|nr:choice-of-anchor A family protein [Streptomyces cinereoruber]MBB4156228.1 choice-of-anchor A domain-containing protein [Streptomyces cinereoruber]NIH65039.1 choice-of-anchor A domain-containing protein [Streptomyces cinereoruber]